MVLVFKPPQSDKSSFQLSHLSVKSFCIATICDWLQKSRANFLTNHDLLDHVFPRLAPVTCICYEFSEILIRICRDWLQNLAPLSQPIRSKTKTIMICWIMFSRAWGPSYVFATSFQKFLSEF